MVSFFSFNTCFLSVCLAKSCCPSSTRSPPHKDSIPPPKKKLFPQPPNPKLNVPQQPTSGKNPSVLATCPQTTHLKIQKLPWPCLKSETALTTGISFPRQHQHVFPVAHLCSPLPSSLPQPEPGDTFCLHLTRLSHHTYTPPGQRALRQRLLRQQLAIPLSAF